MNEQTRDCERVPAGYRNAGVAAIERIYPSASLRSRTLRGIWSRPRAAQVSPADSSYVVPQRWTLLGRLDAPIGGTTLRDGHPDECAASVGTRRFQTASPAPRNPYMGGMLCRGERLSACTWAVIILTYRHRCDELPREALTHRRAFRQVVGSGSITVTRHRLMSLLTYPPSIPSWLAS